MLSTNGTIQNSPAAANQRTSRAEAPPLAPIDARSSAISRATGPAAHRESRPPDSVSAVSPSAPSPAGARKASAAMKLVAALPAREGCCDCQPGFGCLPISSLFLLATAVAKAINLLSPHKRISSERSSTRTQTNSLRYFRRLFPDAQLHPRVKNRACVSQSRNDQPARAGGVRDREGWRLRWGARSQKCPRLGVFPPRRCALTPV